MVHKMAPCQGLGGSLMEELGLVCGDVTKDLKVVA